MSTTRRTAITRRGLLAAAPIVAVAHRSLSAQRPAVRIVAEGLLAPESPKPLADGGVLLVEMVRQTLSKVLPNGETIIVAKVGGCPNGCAIGPDGAAYITNNAASRFTQKGLLWVWSGIVDPKGASCIQRVDMRTGAQSVLYRRCGDTPLSGPNDLVFDAGGSFFFTDTSAPSSSNHPGLVYWARPDGSNIQRVAEAPFANGVVLSPDQQRLLVATPHEIRAFTIDRPRGDGPPTLSALGRFGGSRVGRFDSMAAEADGGLAIGTLNPGGLTLLDAKGGLRDFLPIAGENAVTNIGFGGPDMTTAFATLGQTGRLARLQWPRRGLKLNFG